MQEFVCSDTTEAIQLARRIFDQRAKSYFPATETWKRLEVWQGKRRRFHVEQRAGSPSASRLAGSMVTATKAAER